MSNPNGGFTWKSWQDTQDEALASQRRAEAEECPGKIWLDEFMAEAEEIDRDMKRLKENWK